MTEHKKLVIGLFGFGVVGEGLYRVLQQTESLNATIKKVCIKNPNKKRNAPAELFTTEKDELLNDKEINVIVEVIDDSNAAFDIVSTAIKNGKATVSSSKKMIAEHLPELLSLQQQFDVPFLYEASACASIPVIRNLEEYYDNDLLHSMKAIVNGSTNFILTKIFDDYLTFKNALIQAQQLGFAESNPVLDVEGYDAVNKWSIILAHAYGIVVHPNNIVGMHYNTVSMCQYNTPFIYCIITFYIKYRIAFRKAKLLRLYQRIFKSKIVIKDFCKDKIGRSVYDRFHRMKQVVIVIFL